MEILCTYLNVLYLYNLQYMYVLAAGLLVHLQ